MEVNIQTIFIGNKLWNDNKTICLDPLICASYSGILADHINCLNFALKTFQTSTSNQMTETNDQVICRSQLEILKRNPLAEAKYGSSSVQGHTKGSDNQV